MNSGLASSIGLSICENPHSIILFMETSPKTLMKRSAPPKQNGSGTANISRAMTNTMSNKTIVSIPKPPDYFFLGNTSKKYSLHSKIA